jgi:hypothetical protein
MKIRGRLSLATMIAAFVVTGVPAGAQIRTVDPSSAAAQAAALDPGATPPAASSDPALVETGPEMDSSRIGDTAPAPAEAAAPAPASAPTPAPAAGMTTDPESGIATPDPSTATYQESDVFAAAEGAFGKGAEGLAKLLEKALKEQGRPNAYIIGREAGAAFAVGLRYGSGTMYHKVEGEQPVYWTGPSIGFDIGGNGGKVFVLVYNLFDSQELFRRFPAAEGNLYAVGGFTASYLRRGDVVLIPIRLGVGWRAGVNVGYMSFSKTSKWLPF